MGRDVRNRRGLITRTCTVHMPEEAWASLEALARVLKTSPARAMSVLLVSGLLQAKDYILEGSRTRAASDVEGLLRQLPPEQVELLKNLLEESRVDPG